MWAVVSFLAEYCPGRFRKVIYFQYLKPSALRYGSGPDGSLALAVPAAEILDQADADQSQGEQAGEHRNQRGVAMSLIGRVRDHERGQLVAGQAGNAQALSARPCVVETVLVPKCWSSSTGSVEKPPP